MFTPQEVQERSNSLEKAVFGGYSMNSVEDLLTPLTQDYASLYRDNAILKSKMKVLVDRLEEYRKQEESMKRAILSAQKTADEMITEAERKCAKMMAETETRLRQRNQDLHDEIMAEAERVAMAKKAAAKFIVEIEDRVQQQLSELEQIKQMNITVKDAPKAAPKKAAEKLETPKAAPAVKPAPSPTEDEVARQIEENLTRILSESAQIPPAKTSDSLGDTRVLTPAK